MDVNKKYFSNINKRERAIFEGGITMGALFHQFVGIPINRDTISSVETGIKKAFELQPAIENVNVKINPKKLEEALTDFDYTTLNGDMLNIEITTKVDNVTAVIKIEYIEELNYPLMYVKDIKEL